MPASAAETRKARRLWRRKMLARAAGGESRVELAAEQGVSVRTLQRALKRAAAEAPRETEKVRAALQLERLRRALQLADRRIAEGDIHGVYALVKLMPLVLKLEEFDAVALED